MTLTLFICKVTVCSFVYFCNFSFFAEFHTHWPNLYTPKTDVLGEAFTLLEVPSAWFWKLIFQGEKIKLTVVSNEHKLNNFAIFMFSLYNNVNKILQIIEILTINNCLENNAMQCKKKREKRGVNAADGFLFFCFFYKIVSTFLKLPVSYYIYWCI